MCLFHFFHLPLDSFPLVSPIQPPFVFKDILYIPSAFISFNGHALDERTPLLRSQEAVAEHGGRLLKALGDKRTAMRVISNVGWEQVCAGAVGGGWAAAVWLHVWLGVWTGGGEVSGVFGLEKQRDADEVGAGNMRRERHCVPLLR